MQPILLIGATGNIGSHVLSQLAASGTPVRALVRNPAAIKFPPQVQVVQGDLTLPDTLVPALDGISTVFLVWVAPPAAAAPALHSAPLKTPHPLFQQPNRARALAEEIEQLIESSSLQWTFLRPGMLASNSIGWWASQIRSGNIVRWPFLDVPTAPIHECDIARVAVRALCEDGHHRAEYVLTGPQSLTHAEQIAAIGTAVGRSLQLQELSPEEARRELLPVMPAPVINMLLDAWAAAAGHPAFLTSTVAELTGEPPAAFQTWAHENARHFLPGQ
jgi:uncharacterized protein YbjT (DUF2867 family)